MTEAPTVAPTVVPTIAPTAVPTAEPTATPVANCMDPEVYADLTTSPPLDWSAVPQTQRNALADELEAYDFSAYAEFPSVQEFIDRNIDVLRAGGGLDPGLILSVQTGEIVVTPC